MKKVLIAVVLFITANTAFAQKSMEDAVFQKIDSIATNSDKTWFIKNQKFLNMVFYPAPDSVAIQGKKATMYFFEDNLKTTVTTQFCEKYLKVSASQQMVKIRTLILLYKIRQNDRGPSGHTGEFQNMNGIY